MIILHCLPYHADEVERVARLWRDDVKRLDKNIQLPDRRIKEITRFEYDGMNWSGLLEAVRGVFSHGVQIPFHLFNTEAKGPIPRFHSAMYAGKNPKYTQVTVTGQTVEDFYSVHNQRYQNYIKKPELTSGWDLFVWLTALDIYEQYNFNRLMGTV